ncbi:Retinol dehydrogenase 13 [Armadillidium vulgare]|nr:Retinol dehydrogenase 13 [Armadillidium vulgare]
MILQKPTNVKLMDGSQRTRMSLLRFSGVKRDVTRAPELKETSQELRSIGKETALDLAKRGARVILACRNPAKAEEVKECIMKSSGNKSVLVYKIDTSDLNSINNAGIAGNGEKCLTNDGLELTMATNYFGHFLLTNLLIDLLKKSSPSRIINVSSIVHRFCFEIDTEDLNFDKKYDRISAYARSKICNILFTKELSRRLVGTGVTANSLHPGINEREGAQTTIYAAVSEDLKNITGKYFDNCQEGVRSSLAENLETAQKLWTVSEKIVQLQTHE